MDNEIALKNDLLSIAVERGSTVETIERLMAVRRELQSERAKSAYYSALANFQGECPIIEKKSKVMEKNNLLKARYSYAPLQDIVSQVKIILQKHGFSYHIETEQDEKSLTAICVSQHVDGHSEKTKLTVPIDKDSYMSAPQKIGSARTYAMRYAFCDAFGILTGDADNDANDIDDKKAEPPKTKPENIPADAAKNTKTLQRIAMIFEEQLKPLALDKKEMNGIRYGYISAVLKIQPIISSQVLTPEQIDRVESILIKDPLSVIRFYTKTVLAAKAQPQTQPNTDDLP